MPTGVQFKLGAAALGLSLILGLSGCFLNVYQTADPVPPGQFTFWWGLSLGVAPSLDFDFQGLMAQFSVRYGLFPRLDIGLGAGLAATGALRTIQPWALVGDVRYQLLDLPTVMLGWIPPNFPLGGVISGGALYISWPFGTLTPYGFYRVLMRMPAGGGVTLEPQGAVGLEIANPAKIPAIFELAWHRDLWLLGFAVRF